MQTVTPEQMKSIEKRSAELGINEAKLMENAGKALADFIDDYCRKTPDIPPEKKNIVFLAGSGNNGGDCFVAATKLVYKGYKITVINLCGKPQTELSSASYEKLPNDHVKIIKAFRSENVKAAIEAAELDYMTLSQESDLNTLCEKKELTPLEKIMLKEKQRLECVLRALNAAYVIVDGVFGTGFHGQMDDEVVSVLNGGTNAYRIAVDVPSGGNSRTGTVSEGTFKADTTIVFGYIKSGMTQYPLRKYCGKIVVADIGIPTEAGVIPEEERRYMQIDKEYLSEFPIERESDAYKGNFGNILIIAGNASMRGAAALATLGALRSGAGRVTLASVEKCIDTVSVLAPEATFIELESDDYGFILYDSNVKILEKAIETADAILIGCGMGKTNDTVELTEFVTKNANCPVIIDADGINCIVSDIDILLKKKTDIILTPHEAEMSRLLECSVSDIKKNRFASAENYAEKYGVTVVLKGAGTIVANSTETASNLTGNPGMSKGGSGDVLAGIISTFAAQGYDLFKASAAGVYIHGLAGDIAAEKLGYEAMLPRDIIDALSDSFGKIKKKN